MPTRSFSPRISAQWLQHLNAEFESELSDQKLRKRIVTLCVALQHGAEHPARSELGCESACGIRRRIASFLARSQEPLEEQELRARWQNIGFRRRQRIWRAFCLPKFSSYHEKFDSWWDWSTFSWGLYYDGTDECPDINVVEYTRLELWLSPTGTGVESKYTKWVRGCVVQ
jgi:hypothetical protein